MAKSTLAQGMSHTDHELSDPEPPTHIRVHRESLGEVDQPSQPQAEDGGGSTPSSENDQTSSDSLNPSLPKPAQTTESLSSPDPTESFTADSTDGNGQEIPEQPSASPRKTTAKRTARSAPKATVTDDDDF